MFERYTERARRTLFFARYEATQIGHVAIEPEHLLLGLVREGHGVTARILGQFDITLEQVQSAVAARTATLTPKLVSHEIPFSASTTQVLQRAAQEADRLWHEDIGTEHLLLAILGEEQSVAARVLFDNGLETNAVRDLVVQLRNEAPAVPRTSSEVRISPTGKKDGEAADNSSPDYWSLEGFDLKAALSRICLVPETRIELPSALDTVKRYDFFLLLPQGQGREVRHRLMEEGVEKYFRASINRESRLTDVYVMTAPGGGASPAIRESEHSRGGGGLGAWSMEFSLAEEGDAAPTPESFRARFRTPADIRKAISEAAVTGLSASGAAIADLCHMIERALGRPVVNETGLDGRYDFTLEGEGTGNDDLFQRLRDELGLVLTLGQRDVEMLVVRTQDPGLRTHEPRTLHPEP